MVLQYVRRVANHAADLVLPARCAVCGAESTFLCRRCQDELPRLGETEARIPVDAGSDLPVRSLWEMEGSARHVVHQLKYGGFKAIARPLGDEMALLIRRWNIRPDVITFVPSHAARLRLRGFDQAKSIALVVSEQLGVPVIEALVRTRSGSPQVGAHSRSERMRNVVDAFRPSERSAVPTGTILIVDDVMTTGATLASAARVLRAAGARHLFGATLTRA